MAGPAIATERTTPSLELSSRRILQRSEERGAVWDGVADEVTEVFPPLPEALLKEAPKPGRRVSASVSAFGVAHLMAQRKIMMKTVEARGIEQGATGSDLLRSV